VIPASRQGKRASDWRARRAVLPDRAL